VSIGREQIQAILKAGEREERGMVLPGVGVPPAPAVGEAKAEAKKEISPELKALSPEEERAKEEKEYQRRVREITEQIKAARDRYYLATKGTSSPEPSLLQSEEAMRSRTDDLISRLRDAQHNPAGPSDAGGVKLLTPSPFTGAPPTTTELRPGEVVPRVDPPVPTYTAKEKELSELRNQINQLQKERDRLIEEMKQKNFDTGSLFLE
jgi:hypothetical protein